MTLITIALVELLLRVAVLAEGFIVRPGPDLAVIPPCVATADIRNGSR